MPCLLLIVFLAFPRIALVVLFLFTNYLERAYHGLRLPRLDSCSYLLQHWLTRGW